MSAININVQNIHGNTVNATAGKPILLLDWKSTANTMERNSRPVLTFGRDLPERNPLMVTRDRRADTMTSFDPSEHPETGKQGPAFNGITSLNFFKELQKGRKREIRRRIATDFYARPDVIKDTAEKIIESGDLSNTD